MPDAARRTWFAAAALAAVLIVLAWLRPVDHDESQYVAATALTARGLLPYRDYPYFQTPLQPFLFAPIAWVAGDWTWPMLRLANALLGWVAVVATAAAARAAGAAPRAALAAAGLFAATDILLFSVGTARNDALPAALFAVGFWLAMRGESRARNGRGTAVLTGLLFAGAAAAKISYALPAGAYGLAALVDRRRQPLQLVLGALPVLLFVGWTAWTSPAGFLFGTWRFPVEAPAEYYRAAGRAWKLGSGVKLVDALKFLALGPALLACLIVGPARLRGRPALLDALIGAGLLAALLPSPTWRQYWLPMLPPLFVALALVWTRRSPRRAERAAAGGFVIVGLAPSFLALVTGGVGMSGAVTQLHAIRAVLPAGVPVATLSPQFLPSQSPPDPRFATGPFYFRSHGLVSPRDEAALHLFARTAPSSEPLPRAVLVGGEGGWTSGDPALDPLLAERAARADYRPRPIDGTPFTLWLRSGAVRQSRGHNNRPA